MENENQGPLWEVFVQSKPGQPFKHVGSLHAYDKEMAIESARDLYTRRNEGKGLWIVSSDAIVSINNSEAASFFEPASDKIYRHPSFYNLPNGVKQM